MYYHHIKIQISKNFITANNFQIFKFINSQIVRWAEQGSNLRTRERTDLQSVAFNRSAICPNYESHLSESNQRPTDYKSVALPAELKWLINIPEAHPGKQYFQRKNYRFFRDCKGKRKLCLTKF